MNSPFDDGLNPNVDDHRIQQQETYQCIDSSNELIWLLIFHHLNDPNLASVAVVCKKFRTLAERAFKRKHKVSGGYSVSVTVHEIGWKSVLCRFRKIITHLQIEGTKCPYSENVLFLIEKLFSYSSLVSVTFNVDQAHFDTFVVRYQFCNLTEMTMVNASVIGVKCLTILSRWCPKLKSLSVKSTSLRNPNFYSQPMPKLEVLKLIDVAGISGEKLLNLLADQKELKELSLERSIINPYPERNVMYWLAVVNELLTNLECLTWTTDTFDNFPEFKCNFTQLKSITFHMFMWDLQSGLLKNQLLRITKYLPKIECLSVNCREINMLNHDLIELIVQCSSTLKQLHISSVSEVQLLKFNGQLHKQIYGAENRPEICIYFVFGTMSPEEENRKHIKITKYGIWENNYYVYV